MESHSVRAAPARWLIAGLAAMCIALLIGAGVAVASSASNAGETAQSIPAGQKATRTPTPGKRATPTRTPRATVTPTPDKSIFAPDEESPASGFLGDWEVTDALAQGIDDPESAQQKAIGQQIRVMSGEETGSLLVVELPYQGATEPIMVLTLVDERTAEGTLASTEETGVTVTARLSKDGQQLRVTTGVQEGVYLLDLTRIETVEAPVEEVTIEPDKLVFSDDFGSNKNKWPENKADNATWGFKSGKYQIVVIESDLSAWANPNLTLDDFIVQVEAAKTSKEDAGYGLLFRYADNRNFYRFEVYSTGYYRLMASVDDEWKSLIDWQKSDAIKIGNATNLLKVACKGEQFQFYVNDEPVGSYQDDMYNEGDIALMAASFDTGNVRVNFDKLRVWSVK